jgi:hypothetical protein
MKLRLSVFVGCVLCVVLVGVYGLLSRTSDSRDGWRPSDMYTAVGGSPYSGCSYSGSSYSGGGNGALAVSMRGGNSMLRRRVFSSYAPVYTAPNTLANSQYPIGGTPSNSVASPLYTTSSATMKSFGGGGVMGVSMSGGSVRSSASQPAMDVSAASLPAMSVPALAYDPSASQSLFSEIAMAIPSYQGMGNTTPNAPRAIRGRQNAAPTNNGYASWLRWLDMYGSGYADGYDDETGTYTYSEQAAWNAYVGWFNSVYGCDPGEYGGSSPEVTWEMWLGWFKSNNGSHQGNDSWHNFVPVGDYLPLLFMALLYVAYMFIRRSKVKQLMN